MKVNVTAYPYAVQFGEIDVPEHVKNIEEYICENWDSIEFTEPDLDYAGTDFEFEIIKEEENMKTSFCREFGDDFGYTIIEHFGVLNKYKNGWSKELNLVAWNGGEAKYDIREWDPSHERMSRGITLTAEEMSELVKCVPVTHECKYCGTKTEGVDDDILCDNCNQTRQEDFLKELESFGNALFKEG